LHVLGTQDAALPLGFGLGQLLELLQPQSV
jgi:hypothetical protein